MLGKHVTRLITCGLALAGLFLYPAAASANAGEGNREGHPELYENARPVFGRENANHELTGVIEKTFGRLDFEAEDLGSDGLECAVTGEALGWNEGSPRRAHGEVQSWGGSAHVPSGEHETIGTGCRPEGSAASAAFVTAEGFAASEEGPEGSLVTADRSLSTPWNVEYRCGIRNEAFVPVARIGVPTSESPITGSIPCPGHAGEPEEDSEINSYEEERVGKKGCYKSDPAPPGCLRITLIEPASGLEVAFGGTLYPAVVNGAKNGLSPTNLDYEGGRSGELQCEFPEGCTALLRATGEETVVGFKVLGLLQWR